MAEGRGKPSGPVCQSCGMPLNEDPGGGGTNADGSRHPEYCSYCLQGGQWTEPNITAEEMRERAKMKIKEQKPFPDFMINRFTKDIPKLKRWQQTPTR